MDVHRFQWTISWKSEIKPIAGKMSLLSSASSHLAHMGMRAIPQGQILELGCGTSKFSSKIGAVSGVGSPDPGIFGWSWFILGVVPCCCPASWCLLGNGLFYHASLWAEFQEKCHSLLVSDCLCLTWKVAGQYDRSSRLARRFPRRLGLGVQFLPPLANSKLPSLLNRSWFWLHWPPFTMESSGVDSPKLFMSPPSSDPGKTGSGELRSPLVSICSTFKAPYTIDNWAAINKHEILARWTRIGRIILKRSSTGRMADVAKWRMWIEELHKTKRSLFKFLYETGIT